MRKVTKFFPSFMVFLFMGFSAQATEPVPNVEIVVKQGLVIGCVLAAVVCAWIHFRSKRDDLKALYEWKKEQTREV